MLKNILGKALRILIYSGYLLGLSLVFLHDASTITDGDKFIESSLTEYFQEGAFFITVIMYFLCAKLYRPNRSISVVLGGFFLMAFVREFDAFLDFYLYDGAWQTLVVIILVAVTYRTYKYWHPMTESIYNYANSFPFGLMLAGMMVTFVYSRLFGEPFMWQTLMEENYLRSVKNAAEESIELLGDSVIMFGSIEYLLYVRKIKG
ncbi:hypothetical protein FNH22_22745 [Fulvivirga sp. M361]|uniref:hypothetical protein n=1 Tax=Fulvivirga sp. M361 TaxID=2594266 RepID=UPI00117B6897|nr:hypothetical protein [Fulvivirga sp. M361]TRX51995.1 hypothetical protein FNH22_22745 [Fulvivirga sp. M361]